MTSFLRFLYFPICLEPQFLSLCFGMSPLPGHRLALMWLARPCPTETAATRPLPCRFIRARFAMCICCSRTAMLRGPRTGALSRLCND
ncbi:hypothetical protein BDW69DRAFT_130062 [Aspergillus filifer]